jgi:hypothetical protein
MHKELLTGIEAQYVHTAGVARFQTTANIDIGILLLYQESGSCSRAIQYSFMQYLGTSLHHPIDSGLYHESRILHVLLVMSSSCVSSLPLHNSHISPLRKPLEPRNKPK